MCILGCGRCQGARLNRRLGPSRSPPGRPTFSDRPERTLPEVCALAVSDAEEFLGELELDATGQKIAAELLKEISAGCSS